MECVYFGVHPTLSTWGEVGDYQVLRFALLLSLFLSSFLPLCTASSCSCTETLCSSTAHSLKTELGETDDSLGATALCPSFLYLYPKFPILEL